MNKYANDTGNAVIVSIAAVAIITAGAYIVFSKRADTGAQQDNMSQRADDRDDAADAIQESAGDAMMESQGGVFTSYTPERVAEAAAGDVVLFFEASWCPTCRAARNNIEESGVPDGLTILSVDFDTATDLRRQYGVTTQHTFVQVDRDGTLLTKWGGSRTVEEIVAQTI